MFSETSTSGDEDISSPSESALQDICVDKPSTSSGSEHSEQFAERSLYCLALVNSETGDAVRVVTDEEAEEVARALAGVRNRSKAQGNATLASATPTSRQNSVARPKPGGPCDNCGVMGRYFNTTLLPIHHDPVSRDSVGFASGGNVCFSPNLSASVGLIKSESRVRKAC